MSEPSDLPPGYLPSPQPSAAHRYPPPSGHRYPPTPVRAPLGGARIADIAATAVLCAAQAGLSLLGLFWSMLFPMALDSCSSSYSGRACSGGLMVAAYASSWGGIGVAAVLTVAGVAVGAFRRRVMFVWPLLGTLIVVVAALAGAHFANGAGGL